MSSIRGKKSSTFSFTPLNAPCSMAMPTRAEVKLFDTDCRVCSRSASQPWKYSSSTR